ncbi:MAG: sulfotransferase domain-containing protein [Pseudomonadota bacterium]
MINKLRDFIPHSAKKKLQVTLIQANQLTAGWRVLPDFLIIGAMKAGTSSLYQYLTEHPCVMRAIRKEIHFFNSHFSNGVHWYRTHFPIEMYKALVQKIHQQNCVTGEASPNYIADPLVPERVKQIIPQVKLIVLLRNPIDRAYSHYNMAVRQGFETLSFEQALEIEPERLASASMQNKIVNSDGFYSTLGIYLDQLNNWLKIFPREQFLFIKSEDFYTDPANTLTQVFRFLDLPDFRLTHYKVYHKGEYTDMSAATKARLVAYFDPHNRRLEEKLGIKFNW